MNKLIEYLSSHVLNSGPGVQRKTWDFKDKKELLELPVVKSYINTKNFYRLSMKDNLLVAEYDQGYDWDFIGYIENEIPGFPRFVAKFTEERRIKLEEWNRRARAANKKEMEEEKMRREEAMRKRKNGKL